MIEVRPHTVTYNSVPIIIPVNTPRINHAGCIRFPNVTGRMIAPHSPVKPAAFFFGSTRFTKERPIVTPVSVVEPTIRTPRQAIGDIVPGSISSKAIEQHHWFAIRHPIVILIGDEIAGTPGAIAFGALGAFTGYDYVDRERWEADAKAYDQAWQRGDDIYYNPAHRLPLNNAHWLHAGPPVPVGNETKK